MTTQCPFCKSVNTDHYLKLRDYFLTQEEFDICECNDCRLLFTTPRPSPAEIGAYYKSENYLSHNEKKSGFVPFVYNQVKKVNVKNKFNMAFDGGLLENHKNRILDYGCGVGDFLNYAKQKGCDIYGCDLSDDARRFSSEKLGRDIIHPDGLANLPEESFDVITMWHVLEHVDDLNSLTTELHRLLSDDGRLVVAVPNYQSYDAQYYKDKWAAYDVPRHLNHFHKESLEKVFEGLFELKNILPLKWDSYFISMMSEKYAGNGFSFLKGLMTGCKSNCKAKKSREYSSLVYVFRRI